MKDRLFEALKRSTADYAEIRLEFTDNTALAYRGREIERADSSSCCGGIVRACTKGGWGTAAFDSVEDLGRHVEEACRCAALVGSTTTALAEIEPVDAERPARLERDFRGIGLDEKLRLIGGYNDIILGAGPRIESSFVTYSDSFRRVFFASTRGAYYMEERPKVGGYLVATARDGSLVQQAHFSTASPTTYNVLVGLEEKAAEVAGRAQALLKAPQPEGGPHTVIMDPKLGGLFAHEAFGHLSEADFLHKNPKMRDLMAIGREMGPANLNIIDDGSIHGKVGTLSFDDEGTPTGKTYLIKEGRLAGHLHSLETAARMGARPTGNARACHRTDPPIVRMTNTYIDKGNMTVNELFAGVDKGVYACDSFGGQTEFEMFSFAAGYGYRIENGQKGELLRDVVLTGNVFQTLKSIDGIAGDLVISNDMGGCGKDFQSPLPVSDGAPHIRVRNMVIGGQ